MAEELLIIGGSAEAHAFARQCPQARAVLPGPLRSDPGGVAYEILSEWSAEAIVSDAQGPVILATHPCDDALYDTLPQRCAALGRPLIILQRPGWQAGPGDQWHMLSRDGDVGATIPDGARVFVGLGRSVAALEHLLEGRYLVIRQLRARGELYAGEGHFLDGDAPFTVEHEIAMLRAERIDWLLLRNAGGQGSAPKLKAARALGLPIAMLPRPDLPESVPVVETPEALLDMLARREAGVGASQYAPD
ncbi:precorrin-6A/cobalt-precorrin-6A reductase [Primorskyibacter sp. S187A]|uniref:precorrin-6A/cobalt-precorrin-6A reductase n=1 Tax=Primorskyibacter sp. S187A TaxID=3415130 RepID=UPI003C7D4E9A